MLSITRRTFFSVWTKIASEKHPDERAHILRLIKGLQIIKGIILDKAN